MTVDASAATDVCMVCRNPELVPIFRSRAIGFTLAQAPNEKASTSALLCETCGHVQSPPVEGIEDYYDTGYQFQLNDAAEDDIYAVQDDGTRIYRSEHQAACVADLHDLSPGLRVLDYGSGKARSLELLLQRAPGLAAHAFDVSDIYTPLWDRFLAPDHQASYRLPDAWAGSMDLVLSFFALEHTADPRGFVRELARLLRPGGRAHVVIPNMYRNISDLVVIDHAQHFSTGSLHRLFAEAGYRNIRIDTERHRAAFIVTAEYDPQAAEPSDPVAQDPQDLVATGEQARRIATQWQDIATRIEAFEAAHPGAKAAIYGSGVYGTFIAKTLRNPAAVASFLDMNPYRQGRTLLDVPILAPDRIGADIDIVYVGLNPEVSRDIIAGVAALHARDRDIFYL